MGRYHAQNTSVYTIVYIALQITPHHPHENHLYVLFSFLYTPPIYSPSFD